MVICLSLVFGTLATAVSAAFDNSGNWQPENYWSHDIVDTYTLGDVNDDGAINAKDALALRKHLADESYAVNENGADIVELGNVNAKDLLMVRKHLAGIEEISDYESDQAVDSFTIAGNDISTYSILVPEGTTDTSTVYGNSASLFRKYVLFATGYSLVIDNVRLAEHAIVYHQVDEDSEMGRKLEIENYIYEVVDGDLHIYSTRRGAIFATYDILEEYLGYRFYSNVNTHQYETRNADIPEGTYEFKHPVLDFRHVCQSFMNTNDGVHRYPRHLNSYAGGYGEARWGTRTGPVFLTAHSYDYYWKMASGYVNWDTAGQYDEGATEEEILAANRLYGAKFESGFQQDQFNWNPCFTADEDYAILFRGLLETMRYVSTWTSYDPDTSYASFSICDSYYTCTCISCRKISSDEYFKKDKVYGLGAGGAGLCVYLANRACRDITEYYEGRMADYEAPYEPNDPSDPYGPSDYYDTALDYGMPIFDAYPDMKIETILYDHSLPVPEVQPEDNLMITFCGTACNNHYVGSYGCNGKKNLLGADGDADVDALKAWGKACNDNGAELWYWYYPVNYGSLIVDTPNITNIYHDIKFLVENCHVTGVFYEGAYHQGFQFEHLKAHLAAEVMYSVEYDENGVLSLMTEEEFHEEMKEYLFLYYGEGYEYVYEYLLMYEAASDALDEEEGRTYTCYVNNHDRPGDNFSYYYWQEHYLEMRGLLESALELAGTTPYADAWYNTGMGQDHTTYVYNNASQAERIEFLMIACDTMGLSANCKDWWFSESATAEQKEIYKTNYTWLYNILKEYDLPLFTNRLYTLPSEIDFDKTPLHAFNGIPSWNAVDNAETWGASANMPSWGTGGIII